MGREITVAIPHNCPLVAGGALVVLELCSWLQWLEHGIPILHGSQHHELEFRPLQKLCAWVGWLVKPQGLIMVHWMAAVRQKITQYLGLLHSRPATISGSDRWALIYAQSSALASMHMADSFCHLRVITNLRPWPQSNCWKILWLWWPPSLVLDLNFKITFKYVGLKNQHGKVVVFYSSGQTFWPYLNLCQVS